MWTVAFDCCTILTAKSMASVTFEHELSVQRIFSVVLLMSLVVDVVSDRLF